MLESVLSWTFELGDFLLRLLDLHLDGVDLLGGIQALGVGQLAAPLLVLQGALGVAHVHVQALGIAGDLLGVLRDILQFKYLRKRFLHGSVSGSQVWKQEGAGA